MHNRFKILDVNVSAVDLKRACQETDELIQQKRKGYVCVAPVATIMDCQDNAEYKEVINSADMVTPDGVPLVFPGWVCIDTFPYGGKWLSCLDVESNHVFQASENRDVRDFPLSKYS